MRSFIAALAISTALVSPAHAGPAEDYTDLREEIWQATLDSSPQLNQRQRPAGRREAGRSVAGGI